MPRAGRAAIDGIDATGPRTFLRVSVAAPPADGAANATMIALLAKTIGLPRSAVALVAGDSARVRRLHLRGKGLAPRLEAIAGCAFASTPRRPSVAAPRRMIRRTTR